MGRELGRGLWHQSVNCRRVSSGEGGRKHSGKWEGTGHQDGSGGQEEDTGLCGRSGGEGTVWQLLWGLERTELREEIGTVSESVVEVTVKDWCKSLNQVTNLTHHKPGFA